MSEHAVLLPKCSLHGRIILAKGQLNNLYTFWSMPILKFGLVYFFSIHPLSEMTITNRPLVLWMQSQIQIVMPIATTSHYNFWSILTFLKCFYMVLINKKQVWKRSEDIFFAFTTYGQKLCGSLDKAKHWKMILPIYSESGWKNCTF